MSIVPESGVKKYVPPWMKVAWGPEIERGIYKDWGKYYSKRRRESNAMHYYDKAYDLAPDDYMTLYYRSQSLRKIGKIQASLKDSKTAQKLARPNNYPINLEICDGLHEINNFESSKAELHNNIRIFPSNKSKSFEDRLIVVDGNIGDACGEGLTTFMLDNEAVINHVNELLKNKMKVDNRPLWKKLKEEEKCDVQSIPEIDDKLLSPREVARRKRAFNICNQFYLDRSWIDVNFLKCLRTNPNLLLEQCKKSNNFLASLTVRQYGVVKQFLKMIHARSPMYFMRYTKCADKDLLEKFQEALLYRIQNQTRRNMTSVLKTIRRFRTEKNVSRLVKYVEEVMGEYVVYKTYRIMPWKFEFVNEVYNILGLALADQYYIPKNFHETDEGALLTLLHNKKDTSKNNPEFKFGDRSTHQNVDLLDPSLSKSRQLTMRLEKRMVFAKYSIEKCYLLHQMANIHLEAYHYDECGFIARKAIEETKNCNSFLWRFLSIILIIKSNAALNKTERVKDDLKRALRIAKKLDTDSLTAFVEMCISCNERNIAIKGSNSTPASIRGSKASRLGSSFQAILTPNLVSTP